MTLRTLLNLTCNECGDPYPRIGNCPAPIDGAIFTPVELRRDAKAAGWTYHTVSQDMFRVKRDLCPRCTKKAAKGKQ